MRFADALYLAWELSNFSPLLGPALFRMSCAGVAKCRWRNWW